MNVTLLITMVACLFTSNCMSSSQLSPEDHAEIIKWKNECDKLRMTQPMILVQVYIINENNEILLGKYEDMDLWAVPMGWMQQEDAGFKKCGQRIALQETGMTVENLERHSISDNGTFSIIRNNEKVATERIVMALYTTRHFSGQPQLIQHEAPDWLHAYRNYECWQWCSADDLPENIDDACLTHEELSNLLK